MDIETWALIRRLYFRDGLSQREIAERTGHHRDSIARALAMKRYRPAARPCRGSLLDPFRPKIQKILEEYPSLNALRILEELRKDGYTGGGTRMKKGTKISIREGATRRSLWPDGQSPSGPSNREFTYHARIGAMVQARTASGRSLLGRHGSDIRLSPTRQYVLRFSSRPGDPRPGGYWRT
jgi:hypothetical protein